MKEKYTQTISHYTALVTFDKFQDDTDELENIAVSIVKRLRFEIVEKAFHAFEPIGKTLIFILSQSHLALHTYPENKMIHIDLVSCLELTEKDFGNVLQLIFKDREGCKIITKSCNFERRFIRWH